MTGTRGPLVALNLALIEARNDRPVDTAALRAELIHYEDQALAQIAATSDRTARWALRVDLGLARAGQQVADLLDAGDRHAAITTATAAMGTAVRHRHHTQESP